MKICLSEGPLQKVKLTGTHKVVVQTFPKSWANIVIRVAEVNNLHRIAKVRVVVVRARPFVHVVKRSSMFFVTTGGILCQLGIRITHG